MSAVGAEDPAVAAASRRGRPRDVALDRALLAAAQDLVIEVGYDAVTLEAVAARCGVSRPALYRRWPDKTALVRDAVQALHWEGTAPDTGDLRQDLLELASAWSHEDARRDALMAGLLPAMSRGRDLRQTVEESIGRPRAAAFEAIVRAARMRREIPANVDIDLLGSILPAMVLHHLAIEGRAVEEGYVSRLIDEILLPALGYQHRPSVAG